MDNVFEAAFHTGNEALAISYLDEIATRRDPAFTGYTSTGGALLTDIFLERRKELAFEGHRYWDLARYNQDVERINIAGNYPGVPLTITATNNRRILPIPQAELEANPNIREQQNPAYQNSLQSKIHLNLLSTTSLPERQGCI